MTTPAQIHPAAIVTDYIMTGTHEGKVASRLTRADTIILWPTLQTVPANHVPANATVLVMPTHQPRWAASITWPT
jgi:hypothetical protein